MSDERDPPSSPPPPAAAAGARAPLLSRDGALVVMLLLAFAVRLTGAMLVVPPWQHPDEPQHVEYVVSLARTGTFAPLTAIDPEVSAAVVRSMAEHDWWAYYGRPTPAPLPDRVSEITQGDAILHPRAYYVAAAALLQALDIRGVMSSYWTLRVASALLSLATAVIIWGGTRRALGGFTAHGTLALLVLHPQFALVSTAANPDVIVNLAGALVWYFGVRALAGPGRLAALSIAVLAAIAGALSKRAGFPLLLMVAAAGVMLVPVAWLANRRPSWRLALLAMVPLGLAAVLGALLLPEWIRAYRYGTDIFRMPALAFSGDPDFLKDFSRNLFQSGWLNAGWLTLPERWSWYVVALVVTGLAPLSVLRLVSPGVTARTRLMLLLAIIFVAIQLAAIYATYFPAGYPAQGRYVFPVMGPLLTLIWTGGVGWFARPWRVVAAGVLLAVAFCLDAHAWAEVIIPGFAR